MRRGLYKSPRVLFCSFAPGNGLLQLPLGITLQLLCLFLL